jgi:hypothetical protein
MPGNPSMANEKFGLGSGSRIDLLPVGTGGLADTLTITALQGESFAGLFAGTGTVDLTNIDLAIRTELQSAYVNTDTSVTTITATDGRKVDLYAGADAAATADKLVDYIYYGPSIKNTTTRLVVVGRAFISGTTGDGAAATNTPFTSNIQLFPAPQGETFTIALADFDADFVTAADVVVPVGKASYEVHMALPA